MRKRKKNMDNLRLNFIRKDQVTLNLNVNVELQITSLKLNILLSALFVFELEVEWCFISETFLYIYIS